jgi:two-component sensor histidine kinase/HAMP domain-containing protein
MIEGESLKAAEITRGKGARHVVKIEKAMEALGDFAQFKATDFLNTAELTRQLAFTTIYFLLIVAIIVGVAFAFYLTGTITKPLEIVRAATDKIGKGDLNTSIEVDSNDEIGQLANSFNKMTSDLKIITASRDELDKEITERKQAEEQVKKSLREKDILHKEIHHRVKNNMNVITSLLGLQSKYIHDEKAQLIFQESRNRINSMARIHEKLYRTEDLTSIDVNAYIRTLANDLIGSYHVNAGDIELSISAPEVSLGIDSMIPFGLILNELLSNSLKYAFQDGQKGEIRVAVNSNGSKRTLTVSDNGIGLPEGFDINNTETLGLLLVNSLVRQLNGSIEADGTQGTAFRIAFTEQDGTEGEQS